MTRPIIGRVVPGQRRNAGVPADGHLPVQGPGAARIAVDLLGGDHAPAVVVDGALRAIQADPAVQLLLVGPMEVAGEIFAALDPADRARVSALGSPGSFRAARPTSVGWVESAVRSAVLAVAQGEADAVVSAGNTGATVTAAALGFGRWPSVRRPALVAVLPAATGRVVLIDVGATVDPDEQALSIIARLGSAYAKVVLDLPEPRVGLLTIGTEAGKGDRLRRAAPAHLSKINPAHPSKINYVGLVEGNDVVTGKRADVVVTDGFTGNVLLKGLETAYELVGPPHGNSETRAALLLGVDGTVVVCHGAASGTDLAAGIALAADLHRRHAVPAIAELMTEPEVIDEQ